MIGILIHTHEATLPDWAKEPLWESYIVANELQEYISNYAGEVKLTDKERTLLWHFTNKFSLAHPGIFKRKIIWED